MAYLITLLVILVVFSCFAALADHEDTIKNFLRRGIKWVARMLRLA